MRLKLRFLREQNSPHADIVITADGTATVGDIANAISKTKNSGYLSENGLTANYSLQLHHINGELLSPLHPDVPIAETHVHSGSTISLVDVAHGNINFADFGKYQAVLTIISGPDTGKTFTVTQESIVIGRDQGAQVVLSDTMISKKHARVEAGPAGVTFVDLNSANGILVDNIVVSRATITKGGQVTIGGSVIAVTEFWSEENATAEQSNPLNNSFTRSPRVEPRFEGEKIDPPTAPVEEDPQIFPWLVMVAPLIMGVTLYIFTKSLLSVIFISLSPLMIAGNYFSQIMNRKAKLKRQIKKFQEHISRMRTKLLILRAREQEVRTIESPSSFEIVTAVEARQELLWTRRPEHWNFLNLWLGVGEAQSRTEINPESSKDRSLPEYSEIIEDLRKEFKNVAGVPIIENIPLAGGIGLIEEHTGGAELGGAILAQLTGLHSPEDLLLTAIVDPSFTQKFDWLKWLPHSSAAEDQLGTPALVDTVGAGGQLLNQLEELVQSRLLENTGPKSHKLPPLSDEKTIYARAKEVAEHTEDSEHPLPAVIVLVAGDPPVDRGRLIQLFERGIEAGVFPLWLAANLNEIPAVCRTFLKIHDASSGMAEVGYVRSGVTNAPVQTQVLDATRADFFARSLAPVVDSAVYNPDISNLPKAVMLLQMLGSELANDHGAVIDRWRQTESIHRRDTSEKVRRKRAGTLRALVGHGGSESMHLDLRTQGPHALVGGTTGSGKSEFLQAWVLAMAAEYSPDRVTFLFVDYKGGSAFADCIDLPHSVGLVTDLTPHLVRRALTSLRAEIHYREHLFNRKKVKDIIELEMTGDPECPPALVLVIDEFAALATEIPEFVDGVVDIAQRGRSLGIHLIMATQRPAGVIKDNLRANTNLRIALRMADEADSTDVLGTATAAYFDPAIPGRGIAKVGPGRLKSFQTGYVGGWSTEEKSKASVQVFGLGFGTPEPWEDATVPVDKSVTNETGPNDISRLVASFKGAARTAEIPKPRRPWLDELAPVYDLAKLPQRTDSKLLLAVTDVPAAQEQKTTAFEPDVDGNLIVFGAGGSGKTTLLRTLAVAAGITPRGGPAHVYGIDFAAGGLRMLEALPHVGDIISGDDDERIQRLFKFLKETIDDRVERFSNVRASNITEYREMTGSTTEPRILLLIDGMSTFRQEYEFAGQFGVLGKFQQILFEGRQVGVHVIAAADRPGSVSPGNLSGFGRRIILRLADENDYMLLDIPTGILDSTSPAGRSVIDGLESQVLIFGGKANAHEQALAIEDLARSIAERGLPEPPKIKRLPELVLTESLSEAKPGEILLGMADDTLEAVTIKAEGVFMLSGPPQSGRTTALQTIAFGAKKSLPNAKLAYFGSSRSPLVGAEVWDYRATEHADMTELVQSLTPLAESTDPLVVVIEGVAELINTGVDNELIGLIKKIKQNGHFVVGESESGSWVQSWPILLEFKNARRGFALQPDQTEGDILFKTSLPRTKRADLPIGRGFLIEAGRARKVQVAINS